MNYQSAAEYLGSKTERPYTHGRTQNNRIQRRGPYTIVMRLHQTDVATWHSDGRTVLNTGGWKTPTTKERINESVVGNVYQDRGVWYYATPGRWDDPDREIYVFADGMVVHSDGRVEGAELKTKDSVKEQHRLRREINKFSKSYVTKLYAGEIPAPGGGDCWGCLFHEKGKPGGRALGTDHYLDHLKEDYYVPSMIYNAAEAMGMSRAEKWTIQALMDKDPDKAWDRGKMEGSFIAEGIRRRLRRFILREVGLPS